MSTPMVPARPTRANGTTTTTVSASMPQVPPRPLRKTDPSPNRDFRSPLNELPNPLGGGVGRRTSRSNLSASDLPPRPPSVSSFPSVGQEGNEYSSYDLLPAPVPGITNAATSAELGTPETTRNVAKDMPLHAPKASVPQSTAKSRIETVTGTDSVSAAAAGIGKARPDDDVHKTPADSAASHGDPKGEDLRRVVSHKPTTSRPASSTPHGTSRPASIYDDEHAHGIPQIGQQIPLYKNAGDVQAPSPGVSMSQHAPGVGFFNDGSTKAHQRRKSARNDFAPPGSYGLHSHGVEPHDQFERDWYAKNPDRAAFEGSSAYGRSRPESALSIAQLNKIVNQGDDIGMGTNANMIGTPGDEIAWGASDAYIARNSPRTTPAPTRERSKRPSSGSQPAIESPLRKTSFQLNSGGGDHAIDDDGHVHVDPPEYRVSKQTGGGPADDAVDMGPDAGNTGEGGGWWVERGFGTPILASDEVLKRRESAYMQPAVNPEYHYDDYDSEHYESRRNSTRIPSRPSSRHGSTAHEYLGGNLHRYISHEEPHHGSGLHTPLEEIEEYEPLIPEGEEDSPRAKQIKESIRKRPGLEHHHFPSQDIWEDTPSSLQFHTTVQTPDIEREAIAPAPAASSSSHFETPEQEQQRKMQNPADMSSDQKTLIKPHYASLAAGDRPGVQRFPSRDIWEDTPSSLQYHTTVGGPQMDESVSHPDSRPTTSIVSSGQDDEEARATTGFTSTLRPSIPARPKQRSRLAEEVKPGEISEQSPEESRDVDEDVPSSPEKGRAPPIPDRPKPTVPARPARASKPEQPEPSAEVTKALSPESQDSAAAAAPAIAKTKPAVPTRVGEKISALKAGFMSDLNNRLKIGPSAPPSKSRDLEPQEEEAEKAPLADARKSRARGPARRKPASASPSGAADAGEEPSSSLGFSMSSLHTMWAIDESEELQVPTGSAAAAAGAEESAAPTQKVEKVLTDNLASNTEEPTLSEPTAAPASVPAEEKTTSPPQTSAELARTVSPENTKAITASLQASLAEVGAGPAVTHAAEETGLTSADKAVEEEEAGTTS